MFLGLSRAPTCAPRDPCLTLHWYVRVSDSSRYDICGARRRISLVCPLLPFSLPPSSPFPFSLSPYSHQAFDTFFFSGSWTFCWRVIERSESLKQTAADGKEPHTLMRASTRRYVSRSEAIVILAPCRSGPARNCRAWIAIVRVASHRVRHFEVCARAVTSRLRNTWNETARKQRSACLVPNFS